MLSTDTAYKEKNKQPVDVVYEMGIKDYETALNFLKQPDLLEQIKTDLTDIGVIGIDIIKLLTYLVGLSVYLPRPLCVTITGESSSGKSYLVKSILSLFPCEDVIDVTRLSRYVLYYMKSLAHKIVYLNETEAVRRQAESAYALRVLESEDAVKLWVTAGSSFKERVTTGPVCVIETVAYQKSFLTGKENDTRHLTINLDSNTEQNARIIDKIQKSYLSCGNKAEIERIRQKHYNAIRVLKKHTTDIVIPYAKFLTFPLQPQAVTRTFGHMLTLIQVSAYLHQFQRQRIYKNGRPRILADVKDYEYVYNLLGRVLVTTLMPTHRRSLILLKCIEENFADKEFTRSDLVEEISWAARSVHRYVRHLSDVLEVIEVTGGTGQQGSCLTYRLKNRNGNISSPKLEQILTPDELRERIKKEGLPDMASLPS